MPHTLMEKPAVLPRQELNTTSTSPEAQWLVLAYLAADNDLEASCSPTWPRWSAWARRRASWRCSLRSTARPARTRRTPATVSLGRFEFVSFEGAFHGRTMGALSATWNPKYREPFEPLVPGVRFCRGTAWQPWRKATRRRR